MYPRFDTDFVYPRFDTDFASGSSSAVYQRVYRFTKRQKLSNRRRTHVAQNTRHDQELIADFAHVVNDYTRMMRLESGCVVNIDETNVDFDMPSNTTLAPRGSRTVSVRSSGSSQRATVLLGVTQNGEKFPPFVVFKGKQGTRIHREVTGNVVLRGYPEDLVMSVQDKAWMDELRMLEWIERIWVPWITEKGHKHSLLIMDAHKVHLMKSVEDALAAVGTQIEIVVPGYTPKLQVLDVGINRPFKIFLGQCFRQFMIEADNSRQAPKRQDVARWISSAWQSISSSTIQNTWRHIGIGAIGPVMAG